MHNAPTEFPRFITVDFPQDLIVVECNFVCKICFYFIFHEFQQLIKSGISKNLKSALKFVLN